MAGAPEGRPQAEATYKKLATGYADLLRAAVEYYKQYLNDTVSVKFPDAQIQQAYDWALVSMVQAIVSNPFLGTCLVADYRTSGQSQRPAVAHFLARDSLCT